MFSKPTAKTPEPMTPAHTSTPAKAETTPTPAPTPPRSEAAPPVPTQASKPRVATLIADNMTVEGGVSGDGELQIDGTVRGDLKVGRVTVGESGVVEGSITCEAVEIRGKVVGTITAKQVRLYGSAVVDGDITHEQLAMEIGAFFQGRSLKFQRSAGGQAAQPAQAPASATKSAPSGDQAKVVN